VRHREGHSVSIGNELGKASLETRISRLSPDKRLALEKLLASRSSVKSQPSPIARQARSSSAPLSYAQERLWFLDQLKPGTSLFNLSWPYRIREIVDEVVLERSLNEIVRRHESLRTAFKAIDGEPYQVLVPSLWIPLRLADLRHLEKPELEAKAVQLATEDAKRPFELERVPLVRYTLLRLSEEDYVFLLTMHHIISDAWSAEIFWNELLTIWAAYANGEPSPLPEPPIQYADFAIWQRNWLKGAVLVEQLAYWKKQLANVTTLQLPTDRPRPAVPSGRGAVRWVTIPAALVAELKTLSQREGVTLFMTLLAAFQTLLFRYSGQHDIAVGTFIANRNRAELEGLIGFLLNTLVLRSDFSGTSTFRDVLRQVRTTTLEAYAHQDLPFARVVQELYPERDLSRNPLHQVVFQLLNTPASEAEDPDSTSSTFDIPRDTAIFDLTVTLWATKEGLEGEIEYSTDLFNADTVGRLDTHYQMLLASVVADPDFRVHDILLVSEGERQLLDQVNATGTNDFDQVSIVSLFEAQVTRTPNATAFVCEGKVLTYMELNRHSNQLAHHLRALGVGPEVLVGICLERSLELVVALLGVFKAGGAYLPLDPSYPKQRLQHMVADSGASVLVTRSQFRKLFSASNLVCIDADRETIVRQSDLNLACNITSQNLAYVIYTSGSTGKPKGVAVDHKQILNRFAWMWETYPFEPHEVGCQKTALNFVDSIWELLGPVLRGISTVIVPDRLLKDADGLVKVLADHEVTRMWVVPSFLQMLLESFPDLESRLPKLKFWVSSGEALPVELFERFQKTMPKAVLFNLYGTSEVWDVTWYDPRTDGPVESRVPIGRPIRNMRTYVLDAHLQPVPIGNSGELYVSGVGLARGYIGQPELTAKKFIPCAFGGRPSERLYRSGDLARYRPDGNLEYLGRADQQIKIRGFRIEPEEIESVLSEHAEVKQTVVVARENGSGERNLVAYFVRAAADDSVGQGMEASLRAEHATAWKQVWDEAYRQKSAHEDATFNTNGYNSSYTGLPIPAEEMQEWVDHAVERVLSLRPSRVLDIGCGAGLLLFRIAPHCSHYCGTDFSSEAIRCIEAQLDSSFLSQVRVLKRLADDFSGFEPGSFDVVIINSVIQYFLDVDYLLRVLESALSVIRPGGFVFIGDVRNLQLLEMFCTSVEMHRAPASLPAPQLLQRIRKRMEDEEELVVHPAFFLALKEHYPRISHVELKLRRGRYQNELVRFRYDVILHVDSPLPCAEVKAELDWRTDQMTLPRLRQLLQDSASDVLRISSVPDARLEPEVKALKLLSGNNGIGNVGDLRGILQAMRGDGLDPENICALERDLPYLIEFHWAGSEVDDGYDLLAQRRGGMSSVPNVELLPVVAPRKGSRKIWKEYANCPLQALVRRRLIPQLRSFLQARLPDYMVPSIFVPLQSLPLTPNGKLDRRSLPAPDVSRPSMEAPYVIPRNSTEAMLAGTWAELLGLERVGAYDNFFELGGHSLLAVRVLSRVRDSFKVELPLRAVFETLTVAGLARLVEEAQALGGKSQARPIVRLSREAHAATLLPGRVINPSDFSKGQRG
jgi:amino acid adenylation domain-containing protein